MSCTVEQFTDCALDRRDFGPLLEPPGADGFALDVAAISEDVDASLSTLQWAVTGYMLLGAAEAEGLLGGV